MPRPEIANLSDRQIVQAILNKDTEITKEYLYCTCYPLFKSIFDKYYTDCDNCFEFINEIYVYIMWPHKDTHVSKLASFGFRCSLPMWLKIVAENFCHQLYTKKSNFQTDSLIENDRNGTISDSLDEKMQSLNMQDVRKILIAMSNDRFRRLIESRYLEEKSNEETAELLGVTMPNYYNMHKRAKTQFCEELRKEGLL